MKKLLLLIPLAFLSVPAPIQAQQVNVYQSCLSEVYSPGYYDQYGNFVQGGVSTTNVPCNSGYSGNRGYSRNRGYSANRGYGYRSCSAASLGTIAGGFVAYKQTNRVSNRWWSIPLGAAAGNIVGNSFCNY